MISVLINQIRRYPILVLCIIFFSGCKEEAPRSDGYGNFESDPITVSTQAMGQILYLNVEEGQQLQRGALVSIQDTSSLVLQKKQIEATIGILPKKLKNALAEIEVINNQIENLERERQRVQRLVASKAATTKQLDDIEGQIEVQQKRIQAIRQNTDIANRAILSEKEPLLAQLEVLNDQIRKCYTYNPVQGTVINQLTEQFEVARAGTPLYRIASLDTLQLRFYTDAQRLQLAKLGQQVEVLVDEGASGYRRLEGIISWISSQAEFTPKTIQTKEDRVNLVYALKARVPNPDGMLKIGMPAEVNFSSTNTVENSDQ